MRYSKLFITLLLILLGSNACYAITWEAAFNGDKEIYIDRDSVNWHNDSLYYSVEYYDNKKETYIVAIIQNKNNKVGVVSSCTDIEYEQNSINALTPKVAASFKPLNTSSLLFNANATAIEINEQNNLPKENQNTVNYGPYMRDLQKRIKRNWQPHKTDIATKVVVSFTIAPNGSMSDCKIFKTSGNLQTDESALNAIKKTIFKPLPPGAEESVNMRFTFDYHVIGN